MTIAEHPAAQPWPKWETDIEGETLMASCLWCDGTMQLFAKTPGELAARMTRHDQNRHPHAQRIAVSQ